METPLNERALYYLYIVAEFGGVRAGAEHLGMDPATVSRAVARLEEEVGSALLERKGRGVRLTEAGEVLVQHYRWLRAQHVDTMTRLGELKDMDRGTIDIALGEGFIEDLHDSALSAFCRSYPGISINQYAACRNDIIHMVAEGDVHIGLIYDPPPDPRIQSCCSWVQPLHVMVPPRHPLLKNKDPVKLADVAAYPVGLMHSGFGVRQLVDMASAIARVRLVARLTTNSFYALKDFVCAGLGVAFMPALSVQRALIAGQLHAIALTDTVLSKAEAAIITQRGRQLPAGASKLVECMARSMRAFGGEAKKGK